MLWYLSEMPQGGALNERPYHVFMKKQGKYAMKEHFIILLKWQILANTGKLKIEIFLALKTAEVFKQVALK